MPRKKETKKKGDDSEYGYLKLGLVIRKYGHGKWRVVASELGELKEMTLEDVLAAIKELNNKKVF